MLAPHIVSKGKRCKGRKFFFTAKIFHVFFLLLRNFSPQLHLYYTLHFNYFKGFINFALLNIRKNIN